MCNLKPTVPISAVTLWQRKQYVGYPENNAHLFKNYTCSTKQMKLFMPQASSSLYAVAEFLNIATKSNGAASW